MPLYYAAHVGDHLGVKALGKYHADPTVTCEDGHTPLHIAAMDGFFKVVEALVQFSPPPDVNYQHVQWGRTALHYATTSGHDQVVRALRRVPTINVNIKDQHGRTPLSLAAGNGHARVVETLLKIPGVDVDSWPGRPLNVAVRNNQAAVVRVFSKCDRSLNVNVNYLCYVGRTVLHYAVLQNNYDVVDALLEFKGIKVNIRDVRDMTPLGLAEEKGFDDIACLLRRKGKARR